MTPSKIKLIDLLTGSKKPVFMSKHEARTRIMQGAIKIDGHVSNNPDELFSSTQNYQIQIGKSRSVHSNDLQGSEK